MVALLVALIALIPNIPAWLNRRKRALSAIDAEVATLASLNAFGDELSQERKLLRQQVGASVAEYVSRRSRSPLTTGDRITIFWSVGFLLVVLGFEISNGTATDPDRYRPLAAGVLWGVGGGAILLAIYNAGTLSWAWARRWWRDRKAAHPDPAD